ncbi:MAG: hypothetical protein K0S12_2334 [Bacteroidetes bacterium]|nr:hypothetical protein [Bacteroidota bacterium]
METIETKTAILSLISENFVRMRMKENAQLELEDMMENHLAEQRITGGRTHVVLIDTRLNSMSSDEARKFSSGDGPIKYRYAVAILFGSLAGRIIANSLLQKYIPKVPTKIFSDEAAAIDWLNSVLREKDVSD